MESENSELESGDGLSASREMSPEKSEKQKESSKRAQAQLQKIQKDEKKAKGDNEILFIILSKFIQNPLYEPLVPRVTLLLEKTYSSRFIMSIVALVFPEAAHFILGATGNQECISEVTHLYRYEGRQEFNDNEIHISIRNWISTWIRVSQEFLIKEESSIILTQKLSTLLLSSQKDASMVLADFFSFFFDMRNVYIDTKKSQEYSEFILSEMNKTIQSSLNTSDVDLIKGEKVDVDVLFGI